MADVSGPWDGTPWAEADWYRQMPAAIKSGVIGTKVSGATNGPLAFSSSGLAITLAVGTANVGGGGFSRTAPPTSTAVTANTNGSLSRRDRIVLRRSLSTHNITPVVIAGTPSASPVSPAYTRDATTWDLPMYSFLVPPASGTTITSVIDERTWVSDGVADEAIFSPWLGETVSTGNGTVSSTTTSIVSLPVDIPVALDSVRRIRVHAYVFMSTAAGVGANLTLSSTDGWSVSRSINAGSLDGDFVITRYDTDLTSGPRTYNLSLDSTVGGQNVTWRVPYITADII